MDFHLVMTHVVSLSPCRFLLDASVQAQAILGVLTENGTWAGGELFRDASQRFKERHEREEERSG